MLICRKIQTVLCFAILQLSFFYTFAQMDDVLVYLFGGGNLQNLVRHSVLVAVERNNVISLAAQNAVVIVRDVSVLFCLFPAFYFIIPFAE